MIALEKDEKVVKIFRKHWLIPVMEFLLSLIIALAPIFVFGLLKNNLLFNLSSNNMHLLDFLYFIYLIIIWILGFISWINYYLDIWILTDRRLINIEQRSLFSREISSLRLDKIQDIKIQIFGIINTVLKIGNVHVQTASSHKEFIINHASNPQLIKQKIVEISENFSEIMV